MKPDISIKKSKSALQRALWKAYKKTAPKGKMNGYLHSWDAVGKELGFAKGIVYNVAHGKKPAPHSLIDRVNEVYCQSIHYPRAPLPKECWCGKIHQAKRIRKDASKPVVKHQLQTWNKFSLELLAILNTGYKD